MLRLGYRPLWRLPQILYTERDVFEAEMCDVGLGSGVLYR